MRCPEANQSRIPMDFRNNLAFSCIGIPPCSLSPSTPTASVRSFSCCRGPIYFGFVGNCSWDLLHPAHIHTLLVQEIMPETYNPPSSCNITHFLTSTGCCTYLMLSWYSGGVDQGDTARRSLTPTWIYQSHPGIWAGK